jgi:signal transduction histidine kinase/ActR/RegA family two-component response regulator
MTNHAVTDSVDDGAVPTAAQRWHHRCWKGFLRAATFRRQLSIGVALGSLVLVLSISLLTSWLSGQHLRRVLTDQGERITASLASNSSLALVYAAPENAAGAVRSTLSFPDVIGVEVRSADGRLLSDKLLSDHVERIQQPPMFAPGAGARTERETAIDWSFIAPVWTSSQINPFEVQERPAELLGYVRVVLSKATLQRTQRELFLWSLGAAVVFALGFFLAVRTLSRRLTAPLAALSEAMERTERGEPNATAQVRGPRDIAAMAHAFNRMISVLNEREAELENHRDHLEEVVRERTSELRLAKEKAEEASNAKSQFLARMSHELRTPLNAIMGYAQLLRVDRTLTPRQETGLDTIYKAGEHLLTLIVDILDLARIEAGKAELYTQPMSLPTCLHEVMNILSIQAQDKGLAMQSDLAPDLPDSLVGDEKRLRQVLINLLGNAIKFTDQGSVVLAVRITLLQERSARVRFEVRDTGIGIASHQMERLFGVFEQGGEARHREGGTGLGLAISRQLVRLMGADIQVQSTLGLGSTFWFELDLPLGDVVLPRGASLAVGYEGQPRQVLVVDDVPGNCEVLNDILVRLGFVVHTACSGDDALQHLAAHRCDIVLMDVMMPVMDGLEATRRIRLQPLLRTLRVVVVSANATANDRALSLAAGADEFLAKPIDPTELMAVLAEQLGLRWIMPT